MHFLLTLVFITLSLNVSICVRHIVWLLDTLLSVF